jgi:anti-anti-sigma factor
VTGLTVSARPRGAMVVVALRGELDMGTAPQVERELARHAPGAVTLDLRGLDFVDSSGVRLVIAAHLAAEEAGERFVIVRGPGRVQRVFAVAGLEDRLRFVDGLGDEDERPLLEVALARDDQAPAAARDALDPLARELGGVSLDDVRLLISELVTNSVRHAGAAPEDPIVLRVRRTGDGLRVEVADPVRGDGAAPVPRTPGLDGTGGFGLFLVERLADRWGAERGEGSSVVWFELDAAG